MTSRRAERRLLIESFELAASRDDDFPRLFYDVLFHEHPEVKQLFVSNTNDAQRKMFGQTLMAILDHLEDDAWLYEVLRPMGRQHVAYGVTPRMYDWVMDALATAFAEVCAESWTPEHEAAWRSAYARIAEVMLEGAEERS
jgi:hemoglobin-like flavoprotein